MSDDAEQVISSDSGDRKGQNGDVLPNRLGSSAEQDGLDITPSNTESDAVDNQEHRESSSEESEPSNANEGSQKLAPAAKGSSFSVAHALNMVRQRREQEQRATEAKKEDKLAQRLEKLRERRRRQRRNQRLRKTQQRLKGKNLDEESESSSDHQQEPPPGSSTSDAGESRHAKAGQSEPHPSNEPKRNPENAVEDGGSMLERLPVKKRIKLESANHPPDRDNSFEGTRNNSDNANMSEGLTMAGYASGAPSRVVASGSASNGNFGPPEINRFIPRALLLKMSKASKKT